MTEHPNDQTSPIDYAKHNLLFTKSPIKRGHTRSANEAATLFLCWLFLTRKKKFGLQFVPK